MHSLGRNFVFTDSLAVVVFVVVIIVCRDRSDAFVHLYAELGYGTGCSEPLRRLLPFQFLLPLQTRKRVIVGLLIPNIEIFIFFVHIKYLFFVYLHTVNMRLKVCKKMQGKCDKYLFENRFDKILWQIKKNNLNNYSSCDYFRATEFFLWAQWFKCGRSDMNYYTSKKIIFITLLNYYYFCRFYCYCFCCYFVIVYFQ